MRKISALLLLLVVAACSSTPQQAPKVAAPSAPGGGMPVALTDADRAAVETGVRARVAAAATFRTMIAQRDQSGAVAVCGYVNTGASDAPYIGMLAGGAFTVTDLGGPPERTIAVQQACQARRIYI